MTRRFYKAIDGRDPRRPARRRRLALEPLEPRAMLSAFGPGLSAAWLAPATASIEDGEDAARQASVGARDENEGEGESNADLLAILKATADAGRGGHEDDHYESPLAALLPDRQQPQAVAPPPVLSNSVADADDRAAHVEHEDERENERENDDRETGGGMIELPTSAARPIASSVDAGLPQAGVPKADTPVTAPVALPAAPPIAAPAIGESPVESVVETPPVAAPAESSSHTEPTVFTTVVDLIVRVAEPLGGGWVELVVVTLRGPSSESPSTAHPEASEAAQTAPAAVAPDKPAELAQGENNPTDPAQPVGEPATTAQLQHDAGPASNAVPSPVAPAVANPTSDWGVALAKAVDLNLAEHFGVDFVDLFVQAMPLVSLGDSSSIDPRANDASAHDPLADDALPQEKRESDLPLESPPVDAPPQLEAERIAASEHAAGPAEQESPRGLDGAEGGMVELAIAGRTATIPAVVAETPPPDEARIASPSAVRMDHGVAVFQAFELAGARSSAAESDDAQQVPAVPVSGSPDTAAPVSAPAAPANHETTSVDAPHKEKLGARVWVSRSLVAAFGAFVLERAYRKGNRRRRNR